MRYREDKPFPFGYWSADTSDQPAPIGWPASVDNATALLGLTCGAWGPMTIDEAMKFAYRVSQATAQVTVSIAAGGVSSVTSATALRYLGHPNLAAVITEGNERQFLCDAINAPTAVQPTPGWYGASHAAGGITWDLTIVTRYLWVDYAANRAFISIEFRLEWTKSGGYEASFVATEQVDDVVGSAALDMGTFNIYAPTASVSDPYDFSITLTPLEYYTFSRVNPNPFTGSSEPCRVAATGAFVSNARYNVQRLNDVDIVS